MYYLCRENKDADQLCSYRTADLQPCFRICKFFYKITFITHLCNLDPLELYFCIEKLRVYKGRNIFIIFCSKYIGLCVLVRNTSIGWLYPRHLCRGVYSFRLSVCMFVRSFVRTSVTFVEFASKFYYKVSQVVYISATTYKKAFIFGP